MTYIENLLEESRKFDDSWLFDKEKYFKQEDGFNEKTGEIDLKWYQHVDLLTDDEGDTIFDEQGRPSEVEIYDIKTIDFYNYCWDSVFPGALSTQSAVLSDEGWVEPVYFWPEDLKHFAQKVTEYLLPGILQFRFEYIQVALNKLKTALFVGRGSHELKQLRQWLYHCIVRNLREQQPLFFDVYEEWVELQKRHLAAITPGQVTDEETAPRLTPSLCEDICNFKINERKFISEGSTRANQTNGKILHTVLTVEPARYPEGLPPLLALTWQVQDIQYLLVRIGEVFSIKFPISQKQTSSLLKTKKGELRGNSFATFGSGKLATYKANNAEKVAQIDQQLKSLIKK